MIKFNLNFFRKKDIFHKIANSNLNKFNIGAFLMTFILAEKNDTIIFYIHGSITLNHCIKIREQILLHLDQCHRNYIFDLAQADYIDSSSLGIFVALHKIITQNDGSLTLINLSPSLNEILNSGQLETTLIIKT